MIVDRGRAVKLLVAGQPVALPTETVYGLAARCDQKEALERLFATKKRPFFDPLILHVKNLTQAKEYALWDSTSQMLAEKFWPGPLTFVLPKTKQVLSIVNNGMDTVALRCPQHPHFLNILDQMPCPLAAPSANMFGKTSPTSASHVESEFADKIPVLDGGPCQHGIESTVISVDSRKKTLHILRPGLIGADALQMALPDFQISISKNENKNSPGHLKNHYQPECLLVLLFDCPAGEELSWKNQHQDLAVDFVHWNLPEDPALAARSLYSEMRKFSAANQPVFVKLKSLQSSQPLWRAIIDRLSKASHYSFKWSKDSWLPVKTS